MREYLDLDGGLERGVGELDQGYPHPLLVCRIWASVLKRLLLQVVVELVQQRPQLGLCRQTA